MIDYHSHLLPAVDDGAYSLEESLAMGRALVAVGFTVAHCTPHLIKGSYEISPGRVKDLTAALQREYDDAGIGLRLIPGTEHYIDEYLGDLLDGAVTVGSSQYLLVEAPFRCTPDVVTGYTGPIMQRGLRPLFAHPERCLAFAPPEGRRGFFSGLLRRRGEPCLDDSLVVKLKDRGCRFQGNLGSFAGAYGEEVRERALLFLRHGIYSCVGSDAHRCDRLERNLSRGIATINESIGHDAAAPLFCWAFE